MSTIVSDLLPLFADTMLAQPGTIDEYGTFTASGATLSLPCHIEITSRLVRDPNGQEVASSISVIVAGYNDLTTHLHRYTIPTRYSPATSLRAIAIVKETDEDGPCYEEVLLP